MNKLIIHPGWSKTGTSAIQAALQAETQQLKKIGILYPKSLQEIDCAHHKFALAFQPSGPYKSSHSKEEVMQMALNEMMSESCTSLLISSELSPFYFDYPEFQKFAASNFDKIEIIFTIRPQSDFLQSLFSQLVTDPNVRYRESLLFLFAKNIEHLNYYNNIKRWADIAGTASVRIVPYSHNVVSQFFDSIGIILPLSETNKAVHASVKSLYLKIIQDQSRLINDSTRFAQRIKQLLILLDKASSSEFNFETEILFSSNEQHAIDQYYCESNNNLLTVSSNTQPLLPLNRKANIICYSHSSFSKMLSLLA